jgi:predicted Zn-dependent peptidase
LTIKSAFDQDPRVRVTRLHSGLRIVSERMDHLATVAVGLWIRCGSRHEHENEHGLAHLIEHMAFKGTKTRSARQIVEELENVGGDLNAETTAESTAYFARVMKEDLPLAFDILADIVANPLFDETELQREKDVILQEIASIEDNPEELVFDLFMQQAFAGQALGRPILGTPASLKAFTPAHLHAFVKRHYHPAQIVVSAAGAVEHDALVALAEQALAALPLSPPETALPLALYQGGDVREKRRLEQVHLVLGARGVSFHHPLHESLHVLAQILGGGMSSRLFQELREKRGLCYDVNAFFTPFSDTGIFGVYGGTGTDQTADFMNVLLDEWAAIGSTLHESEIKRAKAQIKVGLLVAGESPGRRADQIARQMLALDAIPSREMLTRRIEAVDRKSLLEALKSLSEAPPTFVILGPQGRLPDKSQLKARFSPDFATNP